jgi:hypothetical protein
MVDPQQYDDMSAPMLVGAKLSQNLLQSLYRDAAHDLLEPMHLHR